ncbi:hypothetical protein H2200_003114 [Cladophialophora chaetospira]|uniref:Uncharacterized protein n=1 Tax=Cladophialophora chaetospira TaxID=386627 RepID=A0AA39CMF5_9EURO|nr:hypothetical protein H2200_003114 [Cladophialophora chaetospira]
MAPIDSRAFLNVDKDAPRWKLSDEVVIARNKEGQNIVRAMTWDELEYKDYILKFTLSVFGSQPDTGFALYIGLHGSIQSRAERKSEMDDDDKVKNAVQLGAVYVALRFANKTGTGKYNGNTWDTHFTPPAQDASKNPSYTPSSSATSFVDSNQIYLLGFSAGGDAVYRLSTNLAGRFAATHMSAGHPGDVQFDNLANTPICLQVGDEDSAFDHNTCTVDSAFTLDALALRHPGYYAHDCYVYVARPNAWAHNSWSAAESGLTRGPILTDLHTWRVDPERGQLSQRTMNTNAIDWVSQHIRNPLPRKVVWNLRSRPARDMELDPNWPSKRLFYWLYLHKDTDSSTTFEATFDAESNSFFLNRKDAPAELGFLLSETMVDFSREVNVYLRGDGKKKQLFGTYKVSVNEEIKKQTLDARGDDKLVYAAAIRFTEKTEQKNGTPKKWVEAEVADTLFTD